MSIDATTTAFITVPATLLIAVVGAVVGGRIQESREVASWIRDRRLDAYSKFESTAADMTIILLEHQDQDPKERERYLAALLRYNDAYRLLAIVGPDNVLRAAHKEVNLLGEASATAAKQERRQVLDQSSELRRQFSQAAREVLRFSSRR